MEGPMLVLSKRVLWVLLVLNWVFVAAFAATLVLLISPIGREYAIPALTQTYTPEQAELLVRATTGIMIIAIASGFAVHILFKRMLAIVGEAIAGDPFTMLNADRLRVVGWALLAIQILDLMFGLVSMQVEAGTGRGFDWSFSVGGWIAVLMVFVLARVFEQGSRMRDELAMTV
jgi:hypothetical protein